VPAANLLGGQEGRGFQQMMSGIEVGRVNVAARGEAAGMVAQVTA
jgi:alkylation response protein AidB-like acyl-CoA dehydrogenase